MSEKIYGICENKCLKEVVPKEEYNNIQKTTLKASDTDITVNAEIMRSNNIVTVKLNCILKINVIGLINTLNLALPDWAKPSIPEKIRTIASGYSALTNNGTVKSEITPYIAHTTTNVLSLRGTYVNYDTSTDSELNCTLVYIVD